MATINGTNGNDSLPGTADDDVINPLLGIDTVDGAGGVDTLNVDYSGLPATLLQSSYILVNGSAYSGSLASSDNGSIAGTIFSNIEKINYTGDDAAASFLSVVVSPVVIDGQLNLDGGGGQDGLDVDFTAFDTATSFTATGPGAIDSNRGTFSNFESYYVRLGNGANSAATADGDDHIFAGTGDDTLSGGAGNDTIGGGTGVDVLDGGAGDDAVIVDFSDVNDTSFVVSGSGVIRNHGSFLNFEHYYLTLGGGANTVALGTGDGAVKGGAGTDTISGGDRADLLEAGGGADSVNGGNGNDIVSGGAGDDIIDGGGGTDVATYGDAAVGVRVTLATPGTQQDTQGAGLDTLVNIENLSGSSFGDSFTGNGAFNRLDGKGGNDTLNGGGGADTLIGGDGNDLFVVDNSGDVISEFFNGGAGGIDTVQSTISYTLGGSLENLTLKGTGAINGTGNSAANMLTGNDAANTLDGKGGNDTMSGGVGNDLYVVGSAGDVVVEIANHGNDTVQSSVSYTLSANVEKLFLTGTGTITGTGNGLANYIAGNSGANALSGGDGVDFLDSKDGNDSLNGGSGADSLQGGNGDDLYVVDNSGDIVTEYIVNGAGGTDTVQSSVSYTLSANVEKLVLTGSAAIDGTGNSLANTITGNAGANSLSGLGGSDTLDGGAGVDSLTGGTSSDVFRFQAGQANGDTITDFDGNGAAAGDALVFQGYGAGATVTVGSGIITISYSGGSDVIHLDTAELDATDYSFI